MRHVSTVHPGIGLHYIRFLLYPPSSPERKKLKLELTGSSLRNIVHGTWRHRSHGPGFSANPGKHPFRYGGTGEDAGRSVRTQVKAAAQASKKMNFGAIPCILLLEFINGVFLDYSRNCRSGSPTKSKLRPCAEEKNPLRKTKRQHYKTKETLREDERRATVEIIARKFRGIAANMKDLVVTMPP